tara:strand:+ start:345 stop:692 length:348 start_codon:yes stop_codon:yes gene_type:complete
MKKIFFLLSTLLLLNGCAESIALIGTSSSKGKIVQSSLNSVISYGVKKQTGKSPLEHAKAYADKKIPDKKQISLTNTELAKKSSKTMQKFPEISKIKKISLIEEIAKKSVIYNRR